MREIVENKLLSARKTSNSQLLKDFRVFGVYHACPVKSIAASENTITLL